MILDNVFFLCVAIVVIEVFNEFRINNYGRILDRFFYLFNVRNIFNTIKISSFLAFLIILFFKNVNYFKDINLIVEKLDILELNYIPAIAFTLITIVFRYERLKTEFGYSFTTNSSIIVNLKYIIFRLVSFVFVFYVFKYVFIGIYQLDSYFLVNKMNIFDWYNNELINKSLEFDFEKIDDHEIYYNLDEDSLEVHKKALQYMLANEGVAYAEAINKVVNS